MPENKNETIINLITLSKLKNSQMAELDGELARSKSRISVLISSIKAKNESILAEQREREEKAAAEAAKKAESQPKAPAEPAQNEPKEVKPQKETPQGANETQPQKEQPAKKQDKQDKAPVEEKKPQPEKAPATQNEPKKEQKDAAKPAPAPKPEKPKVELGADGKARRIYTPDPPTPKKNDSGKRTSEKTRVFSPSDNRSQRPQGGRPQSGNGTQPGGQKRPYPNIANMPAPTPQKGGKNANKNGKGNNQNSSGKFDDRSSSRYSLIKKGFIDDDRVVSYDDQSSKDTDGQHRNRHRERGYHHRSRANQDAKRKDRQIRG